jgi:hypothetical protein
MSKEVVEDIVDNNEIIIDSPIEEQSIPTKEKVIANVWWKQFVEPKYLLLLFLLAMIKIWSNHSADTQMKQINKLGQDLKEMRWEYLTTSADLMNRSKQSEVVKQIEGSGLKEISSPPYKILESEDNYKVE